MCFETRIKSKLVKACTALVCKVPNISNVTKAIKATKASEASNISNITNVWKVFKAQIVCKVCKASNNSNAMKAPKVPKASEVPNTSNIVNVVNVVKVPKVLNIDNVLTVWNASKASEVDKVPNVSNVMKAPIALKALKVSYTYKGPRNRAPKVPKATKVLKPTENSNAKSNTCTNNVTLLSFRQRSTLVKMKLMLAGNVERNPGPKPPKQGSMMVTTYNVRGLNEEKKVRHLFNYFHKAMSKDKDFVACLQETYIEKEGKIPYIWRGNLVLTPGSGNGQGCMTLLSSHLNVVEVKHLRQRAHILACKKAGEERVSYLIANLYAPNVNNAEKIQFFEEVFDALTDFEERHDCRKIIVAGDYNVAFKEAQTKNRLASQAEKRIAESILELAAHADLANIWENKTEFTWRRPNTDCYSTIDHVFYSKNAFEVVSSDTNWALSMSDHAAAECWFKNLEIPTTEKSRITRLDPSLAKEPAILEGIKEELRELMSHIPNEWNPHLKLDYIKMCIRTVWEKAQADRKRNEKTEEDFLNEELDKAIKRLAQVGISLRDKEELVEYIEELRLDKSVLIERKGERLAERLGTKWYNEGEKSNKYFMRLLNRAMPDSMKELEKENGLKVTKAEEIEQEIVIFYRNLYENYDKSNLKQDNDETFFNNIFGIPDEKAAAVVKDIATADLKATILLCKDSSPGPDGISYSILNTLWEFIGDALCDSWRYSMLTGKLPASHKVSFLRLIPKAGKDLKKLTNWRPITLSNCDHKVITKTYSNRLCEALKETITEAQTAYLKNRLINDNIRGLLGSIEAANNEDEVDALIVSLDAKKAFDSVEHSYIEECLIKFGLGNFVPIFRTLYNELESNIIINGKISKGFKILRGVKQGDALSCVLFIICMEPLIRNIDSNREIKSILSRKLGVRMPKIYAYADDVSTVCENNLRCLQLIFKEYERLTWRSGLELNADKTEILQIKSGGVNNIGTFRVRYLDNEFEIKSKQEVKVNGILLQQNSDEQKRRNVMQAIERMETRFKAWTRRRLSTLGKVLIAKTFGISNVIYLMQSIRLNATDYKNINAALFKFIWNRNYLAPKAPERLKRSIMNKAIHLGGYGMLDVSKLDESLKIKAVGRLLTSEHPFLKLVRSKVRLESFFDPKCEVEIDGVAVHGLQLLGADRRELLECENHFNDRKFLSLVKDMRLSQIVKPGMRQSLAYFNIWHRGRRKVGDLTLQDLNAMSRIVEGGLLTRLKDKHRINSNPPQESDQRLYFNGKTWRDLVSMSSREIREIRSDKEPMCLFKVGMALTPAESINWFNLLRKLTSTRHKDTLLRIIHGEIYTKAKLFRFNLIDNPGCPRCGLLEDLNHKIFECTYARRIWGKTLESSNRLRLTPLDLSSDDSFTPENLLATVDTNPVVLTLHAEICNRILMLKDDAQYLVRPKVFVINAIKHLIKRENRAAIKDSLGVLLE